MRSSATNFGDGDDRRTETGPGGGTWTLSSKWRGSAVGAARGVAFVVLFVIGTTLMFSWPRPTTARTRRRPWRGTEDPPVVDAVAVTRVGDGWARHLLLPLVRGRAPGSRSRARRRGVLTAVTTIGARSTQRAPSSRSR